MVKIARAVLAALSIRRKDYVYRWYLYNNL
jgi:hypothetical protein